MMIHTHVPAYRQLSEPTGIAAAMHSPVAERMRHENWGW